MMKRWVFVVDNRVENVTMDLNRPFNDSMWKQIDNESLVNIGWIYDENTKTFKHNEDETLTETEIHGDEQP